MILYALSSAKKLEKKSSESARTFFKEEGSPIKNCLPGFACSNV
jgi:hypothetical protein